MNDSLKNVPDGRDRLSSRFLLRPVSAAIVAAGVVMLLTLAIGCRQDETTVDDSDEPYLGMNTDYNTDLNTGMDASADAADRAADDVDDNVNDTAIENDAEIAAAIRVSKLSGVPEEIRPTILEDLQGASISSVESVNTEAGILYRVNYIQNGQARQATYDRSGRRIGANGQAVGNAPGEATGNTAENAADNTPLQPDEAPIRNTGGLDDNDSIQRIEPREPTPGDNTGMQGETNAGGGMPGGTQSGMQDNAPTTRPIR